jgi:Glycosyl hydrolases family 16
MKLTPDHLQWTAAGALITSGRGCHEGNDHLMFPFSLMRSYRTFSGKHREGTKRMEPSRDLSAHQQTPGPPLSRRSLLGWSVAGAFGAAAGLFPSCTAHDDAFYDVFAGRSLSRKHWNPYICDNNSHGWPWFTRPSITVASSAIADVNGPNAEYDLPSALGVDDGLTLGTYRGTKAAGYSWTGSVICSRPTSNNFGFGTIHTAGFTFADARVEVRAKMPDLTSGQWPAIWFLPGPGGHGAEIDLFEGGYLSNATDPNHLMAINLRTGGNGQQFLNCRTDLSAAYHTYAMEYRQASSIKYFFDSSNVYTYTRNVPVGHYFIILSNAIASARTVGWHTQVRNSTPAINRMHVSYVRVMAL